MTHLQVYPNPTDTVLYIKGIEVQNIKVINANGKTVLEQKNGNAILINDFASGLYFIKIKTVTNKTVTKKFIKS